MRDSEVTREVSDKTQLDAAVAATNDKDTIKLINSITGNITPKKLVNFDLNSKTLTGNINIASDTEGILTISAGTITGDLTVDTQNATVNNSTTVNGTITINDVASGTWNEKADKNTIVVNVADKTITLKINIKFSNYSYSTRNC